MFLIRKESNKGFTLIELLVVVAIIGMLVSIIMVGFGTVRQKSRDARRLSDITQIKTGLDLYFNSSAGYPDTAPWNFLQASGGILSCNGVSYFKVPNDPNPQASYTYTGDGGSATSCGSDPVRTSYKLEFTTELMTSYGTAGTYCLRPTGVIPGSCP